MKEEIVDKKKDIKKQRIKRYFLEATKEIIINEGVNNVSVRKVADLAGYSYATIYNYFKDLNELLWDVKEVMISDLVDYIQKEMYQSSMDLKEIKRLFRTYAVYYFKNPNIFQFFYFYKLSRPVNESKDSDSSIHFEDMWKATFQGFVLDGTMEVQDIEVISKILIYAVHGLLMLNYSNNGDLTEENVYRDLEKIIDHIL
jgi:AcrR family transcriptional regulator